MILKNFQWLEYLKFYQNIVEITKALKIAKDHIKKTRPDVIILVDYVEFNLKIAKYAKSIGLRVIFYMAPQLWAWRENRARTLIENIDYLAVIFPFEETFFKKYTSNVVYVGHPLFENQHLLESLKDYDDRDIDLGIFPGSRESEIKNNIYSMLDCIQKNKNENIKIFYANQTSKDYLIKLLPVNITLCLNQERTLIKSVLVKKHYVHQGL